MCYNFEDLYQKSKSILFSSPSKLKEKIEELNQKNYYVSEKQNIKKILYDLENQLIKSNALN